MKTISLESSPKHRLSTFAGSARFLWLFGLLLPLCAPARAQSSTDPQAPLTSIESILALAPASVNLRQGNGYNPVGVKLAEDAIVTQATGRTAALSFKVEVVEPTKDYGFAYHVQSPITPFSARGVSLTYEVWGLFKEDQGNSLAKVQRGGTVIVAGTLEHCNIIMHDGKPLLRVDLANARLYNTMSDATATPLASTAGRPSTLPVSTTSTFPGPSKPGAVLPSSPVWDGKNPAAFVGAWTVINLESASHEDRTLGADHTVSLHGESIGSWEIKGPQFLVHLNLNNGVDAFELPTHDGAMRGKNLAGEPLALCRQDTPLNAAWQKQLVGTWDRFDTTLQGQDVITLAADGTYQYGGQPHGRWKVCGDWLLVGYDGHPDWTDLYTLPMTNGVLAGTNSFHNHLKLMRQNGSSATSVPGSGKPASFFGTR